MTAPHRPATAPPTAQFEEKRCGHLPTDKKRAAQAAEEPARAINARP